MRKWIGTRRDFSHGIISSIDDAHAFGLDRCEGSPALFGNKRLHAIFETVRRASFTPAARMAELFDVTERTLRSDIAKINAALEGHGAFIDIKRGQGYHLVVQNEQLFDEFFAATRERAASEPDLSSADARIRFLLHELLVSDAYRSYDELAEVIYVSDNTLQNYIRHIKDILTEYDLALLVKPGVGVNVLGREDNRRRCFMERVLVRNMRSYVKGFTDDEARLFPHIDLEELERIVRRHLERSDIVSTDYGFKNILVHTALMVHRIMSGCPIETSEDAVASTRVAIFLDGTCQDLERAFSISICQAERGYLLLHILSNTNLDRFGIDDHLFRTDVDALLDSVMANYGFDLRDDAELKRSLLQHLASTFSGKDLNIVKKNPLLNTIRSSFPLAFEIALASTSKVFSTEPYTLSEDEVGYVALHLGAAIERHNPVDRPLHNIMLVCGSSNSIARMLESRLLTYFGDRISIARCISYRECRELAAADLDGIAFIVTTVPLESAPLPHVLVDFSLSTQDTETISRMLNGLEEHGDSRISSFFDHELFFHLEDPLGKGEVLETLCTRLEENGYTDASFLPSVLERETLSDTTMDPLLAIPHSLSPSSAKTKVAVAVLDHPLDWNAGSKDIRIVFLLAVQAGDRSNIEHLYDLLLDITNNRRLQQDILSAASFTQFMNVLENAKKHRP